MDGKADDLPLDGVVLRTGAELARRISDRYSELCTRIAWICWKRGVPTEDARDLAQETIMSAVQQAREGRFRGDSKVETWIISIAVHKVASYLRQRAGGRVQGLEAAHAVTEDNLELRSSVRETLGSLPAEHRLVLLLNVVSGYTTREIALMLERSPGRTGAILAEAKEMFRNNFAG